MTDARMQIIKGCLYAIVAGAMAGMIFYLQSAMDAEHRLNAAQHAAARHDRDYLREQFHSLDVKLSTNQSSINRVLDAMGHKVLDPPKGPEPR